MTAPFLIACEANTPEWYQARAGLTTASTFSVACDVMSKDSPKRDAKGNPTRLKGQPTGESDELAIKTAFEIIDELPYPPPEYGFSGGAAKRGHEEEWLARAAYMKRYDVEVLETGVMVTYDKQFGYSTDGEVEGKKGGIEIKTPQNGNKLKEILSTANSSEYEFQIQGGLWICGWDWIDLIIWMPQLKKIGNELYVKRIVRNDNFIASMEVQLLEHRKRVMEEVAFFSIPHANRPGMNLPYQDVVPRMPSGNHIGADALIAKAKAIANPPPAEPPVEGLKGIF